MAVILYNNVSLVLSEFDGFIKAASKDELNGLDHYSFAAMARDIIINNCPMERGIEIKAINLLTDILYNKNLILSDDEVVKILVRNHGQQISRFIRGRLNVSFDEYYNGYSINTAILP